MIRDALDPAHESEKVHVKEKSEDEEAILSYQQLNTMLAAMDTDSHTENTQKARPATMVLNPEEDSCYFLGLQLL